MSEAQKNWAERILVEVCRNRKAGLRSDSCSVSGESVFLQCAGVPPGGGPNLVFSYLERAFPAAAVAAALQTQRERNGFEFT